MASGHVNRTYRPNTWLHRPSLLREESPCQSGAVHTWHHSAHIRPTHMGTEDMTRGEYPERLAVMRIDSDRFFKERLRHHIVLRGDAPEIRKRSHDQIPGVKAPRRLALRTKIFRCIEEPDRKST